MKNIYIAIFFLSVLVWQGCDEKKFGPVVNDGVAPEQILNVVGEPIPGGFTIKYDLPNNPDLLYVKAEFKGTYGQAREERASVFANSITIKGLQKTELTQVKLSSVDRGENASEPVLWEGTPLKAPVDFIADNLIIGQDFGGAKYSWLNPDKDPIVVMIYHDAKNGELELVKNVYSEADTMKFNVRGLLSVPTNFTAIIRDKYDNFSDTIFTEDRAAITPIKEDTLKKELFRELILPNDDNWTNWEGKYDHFYDDDINSIVHTKGDHKLPSIYSVDLGVEATLSRFKVYKRKGKNEWLYGHGQIKDFDLYGALELPLDEEGNPDGDLSKWTLMKRCNTIKPSKLDNPNQFTDEDLAHAKSGDEFTFDKAYRVRYLRMAVKKTWDGSAYINASEISVFGQIDKLIE